VRGTLFATQKYRPITDDSSCGNASMIFVWNVFR